VRLAPSSKEYSVCRCKCTKSSRVAMADVRSFSDTDDHDETAGHHEPYGAAFGRLARIRKTHPQLSF
jgi:hypothetical protein